jgi:hypothetical protein
MANRDFYPIQTDVVKHVVVGVGEPLSTRY